MTTNRVEQITEQVKALPAIERDEFFSWLSDFQFEQRDAWDSEIARDSLPGGRLDKVLERVRGDIAQGRTQPLDQIVGDS